MVLLSPQLGDGACTGLKNLTPDQVSMITAWMTELIPGDSCAQGER